MFLTKLQFHRSLYLLLTLCLFYGCEKHTTLHKTDIDNLYAYRRTQEQQDSIALKYKELALQVLNQTSTLAYSERIDSLITQLRWGSDKTLFFDLVEVAEKDAISQRDYSRLAHVFENVAVYYNDKQQLDSVYNYYLKAEHLYKKTADSLALAENNYYQARLLYEIGFFSDSEAKLKKAMLTLNKNPNNPLHIEAAQLQSFYPYSKEPEDVEGKKQAIITSENLYTILKEDYGKFTILPQDKYYMALSNLCGNLALHYLFNGHIDKSKQICLEGLSYAKKGPAKQVYAYLNTNYNEILYLEDPSQDVIPSLLESYQIYEQLNHPYYMIEVSLLIAKVYSQQNKQQASLDWLIDAYKLADEHKFYQHKAQVIAFLLQAHPHYKSEEFIAELINNSHQLNKHQKLLKESFSKIEFDAFVLEQENSSLKGRMLLLIAGGVIIIGGLLFYLIVAKLRSKNQALAQAFEQQSKNEQILNLLLEKNNIEQETTLKERNRIAKDLHDGVINSIFTLRFNTQLLQIPDQELKDNLIQELISLETTIRNTSHALAQRETFSNKSFENILEELVKKQNNKNNTDYSFECNVSLDHLTNLEKINIYQIIQESFQNVNKHANATKCCLNIAFDNEHIIFKIHDNGIGIKRNVNQGIGLKNMKERALNILAQLKIDSNPTTGTTVWIYIPTI